MVSNPKWPPFENRRMTIVIYKENIDELFTLQISLREHPVFSALVAS